MVKPSLSDSTIKAGKVYLNPWEAGGLYLALKKLTMGHSNYYHKEQNKLYFDNNICIFKGTR